MLRLLLLLLVLPAVLQAEAVTLMADAPLFRNRGALVQIRADGDSRPRNGASLFIGQTGQSLFAPVAPRQMKGALPPLPAIAAVQGGTALQRLRQLIGHAESRRHGYDAVQHGARIKPAKPPTAMTIAEIYRWIDETPGQPHAIGRYQFIPPTLKRVVRIAGLGEAHRFSPGVQDRLADVLLAEAGLGGVQAGTLPREAFMANLAKIWAGLPTASGKSHYDGYAGNRASITWAQYSAEMARIFPG
ncbi:hypothetical protein [Oceaniglobus trochenteri]|uniref:hypothetical protein n=1 Tax=Oceaniglobus trochenteri TaxID=2763260 RepID=UPI001D000A32|nr:hypothetical protein [Oceaniglobus trochenteri]